MEILASSSRFLSRRMLRYNWHDDVTLSEDAYSSPSEMVFDKEQSRYSIKCSTERVVRAVDDKIRAAVWFQAKPLDAAFIDINRICSIRLRAQSHDQGYVSDRSKGNWTWFELSILAKGSDQHPKTKEGLTLTWESHRNRMASCDYDLREGPIFGDQHDLLRFLEEGDVIAVRLCARFPGWEIYARDGCLELDLSRDEIPHKVPQYEAHLEKINVMERVFIDINKVTLPEMDPYIARTPATHFPAGIFAKATDDEPPLRVLSLDGGGVRGLASLHLLNAVMKRVSPGKKPYEVFDMIGGTSTEGLIAIMLGRLKMTVDECIQKYETLMDEVFPCRTWLQKTIEYYSTGSFYSASGIEQAIKNLLTERQVDQEALLFDEENPCKIFVTATFEHAPNNRGPLILRSYTNKQAKSELPSIKLWQAARATSAAPAYFEPIRVDNFKLVDGGLGASNPLGWLWTEVLSVYGTLRPTDCFLSIGTGINANSAVASPGRIPTFNTITSFAKIATNSEITHILFRELINAFAPRPGTPKYWRLNISEEIPEGYEEKEQGILWRKKVYVYHPGNYVMQIALDDTSRARDQLMKMVHKYLGRDEVDDAISACAQALRAHLKLE